MQGQLQTLKITNTQSPCQLTIQSVNKQTNKTCAGQNQKICQGQRENRKVDQDQGH